MATRSIARELPSLIELYENRDNRAQLRKWWHLAFKRYYKKYKWEIILSNSDWVIDGIVKISKPLPTCFRDKVSNHTLAYMIYRAITQPSHIQMVLDQCVSAMTNKSNAVRVNADCFGRYHEWTGESYTAAFNAMKASDPKPKPPTTIITDDDMTTAQPAVHNPSPIPTTPTTSSADVTGIKAKADAMPLSADKMLKVSGDKGVMTAMDNLLHSAGSKYSINELVNGINMGMRFRLLAEQQESEIARLKQAARDTPKVTGTIAGYDSDDDLSIPSGEITYKMAYDVFEVPSSEETTRNALSFEVPIFEWDGEHPWVPEADEHYQFNVETLLPYLSTLIAGKNAWLYGHTGTGKTTLAQQVCAKLGWPMRRVNFDGDISRLDLVGQTKLDNDDGTTVSKYVDGILPQAMNSPTILLLDELDVGRPDVLYALQNALDQGQLTITDDGGRRIKAHPFFRAVAACNTQGQGDDSGLYQGTRVLSRALLNRFHNFIPIDYMRREDEMSVLISKVPALKGYGIADKLMQYVHEHRVAFTSVEVTEPISLRNIIGAAQEYVFYATRIGHADAINLAISNTILNRANPEDRIVLRGIAQRVFPGTGF